MKVPILFTTEELGHRGVLDAPEAIDAASPSCAAGR